MFRRILIRGFVVGFLANFFQILGEVNLFSDAPISLPMTFVFKTLSTVILVVGILWILLSVVKIEEIRKE